MQLMSEQELQIIASLKIVWIAAFSYLYGRGGMQNKYLRRFIGAACMMLGIFVFSKWQGLWNYWYLAFLPIAIGGLHNGYGADKTWDKIRRRTFQGFCFGLAGLPLACFSHLWTLFGFSVALSVLSCVVVGAFDAPRNARDNETIIATLCFLLTLYLI